MILNVMFVWSSGGSVRSEEQTKGENPSLPEKEVGVATPDDRESRIQAARDRFLSRKTKG